jgi:hypothetical protein
MNLNIQEDITGDVNSCEVWILYRVQMCCCLVDLESHYFHNTPYISFQRITIDISGTGKYLQCPISGLGRKPFFRSNLVPRKEHSLSSFGEMLSWMHAGFHRKMSLCLFEFNKN